MTWLHLHTLLQIYPVTMLFSFSTDKLCCLSTCISLLVVPVSRLSSALIPQPCSWEKEMKMMQPHSHEYTIADMFTAAACFREAGDHLGIYET
jgi:hypothetical protein